MKRLAPLLLTFIAPFAAYAGGPIHVLYLGKEGTPAPKHCHVLMEEFGRDAIWFDYASDPATVTPGWLKECDAVLLDAPGDDFKSLPGLDPKRVVTLDANSDPKAWGASEFLTGIRGKLLDAIGDARRKEWETFLAQREPEKREPNPYVANYEKRPQPITFQEPMSVKASMQRTQTPADLRLELFASEPDIAKPIAFAWDDRGRLWVAETRDYPHGVTESGEGNDDIKICEDTDGDGKADKFTIFADHLNLPTSLVFANGGVIVTQSPRMLFLKSTKGDDHADVRQVIMDGWGIRDTHAQANNLHYGFDNWLYGCVGYSGFKGKIAGKEMEFHQGTYRFKADGSALEFLHQFSNNSWGHSTNAAGDQFGGTANNAPIFYGGIPATAVPPGIRVPTAKRINIEDRVHAITPNYRQVDVFGTDAETGRHWGGYTAAAGSSFVYSANLPARLQGKAMVCEPTMKVISLMDVKPDGAGYIAKDGFNLVASTDEWMSPVFSEVGPDGAVWFADWENFIIQHNPTPSVARGGFDAKTGAGGAHENPLRDHARGRIYRLVWNDATKPAITSLKDASTTELVSALKNDTLFWRLTAQRLLVEGKKTEAVDELKKIVIKNDGSIAAVHALWTLQGLGQLDKDTHLKALAAKDPALRRNAIRALGADQTAQQLYAAAGAANDADPVTRLAAFVKMSEFPTSGPLKAAVKRLILDPKIKQDEWLSDAARILAKKHDARAYHEGPNLLPNPGFEIVGADGLPEGWARRDYGNQAGNQTAKWQVLTEADKIHGGTHAVRCITYSDGDTSLHFDLTLKPNTQYKLSGWVKSHALTGKISLNDHITHRETDRITSKESEWTEVETTFNSGNELRASINILQVGKGDGLFDDVKLCELIPETDEAEKVVAGDAKRGEEIFFKHAAACVLCHSLRGQGGTVGPPLDGIASRESREYIIESLLKPNAKLAKGYESLGTSPMPPVETFLTPQQIEDIEAFVLSLKK